MREDCWAAHKAWLLTLAPEIPWRCQGESDTESDPDKSENEVPAAARAACESPPTQRQSDKTLISTKWRYKVKPSTRAHWGSTDENEMKKRSRRQRQSDNAREQRRHCGSTESDTE